MPWLTRAVSAVRAVRSGVGNISVLCDFTTVSSFSKWTRVTHQVLDTIGGFAQGLTPFNLNLSIHTLNADDT